MSNNNEEEIKPTTSTKTRNTKTTPKKQPTMESIHRRKEDELKYNIMNQLMGIVKWLVVGAIVALFLMWNMATTNSELIVEQNKKLTEIIDQISSDENKLFTMNLQAFNVNKLGKDCKACHLNKHNLIDINKHKFDLQSFKDFVRGTTREKNKNAESYMPKFEKADDISLEGIYLLLKGD